MTDVAAVGCRLVPLGAKRSERLPRMRCMQLSLARAADSLADSDAVGRVDPALGPGGRAAAEWSISDDNSGCLGSSSAESIDDFHFAHTDWAENVAASIGHSVAESMRGAEK